MASQFNHLTCENAMKIQNIHPAEDTYDWAEADRIADFARDHGMKLTGHTLLWHRQAPDWLFAGVTAGDSASLDLLKARLNAHIIAVVGRYADVVDNWDVVNEAISSSSSKTYRDGSEGSMWYQLFGSEEYIYWGLPVRARRAGGARARQLTGPAVLQRLHRHLEGRQDPDDVRLAGRQGAFTSTA